MCGSRFDATISKDEWEHFRSSQMSPCHDTTITVLHPWTCMLGSGAFFFSPTPWLLRYLSWGYSWFLTFWLISVFLCEFWPSDSHCWWEGFTSCVTVSAYLSVSNGGSWIFHSCPEVVGDVVQNICDELLLFSCVWSAPCLSVGSAVVSYFVVVTVFCISFLFWSDYLPHGVG